MAKIFYLSNFGVADGFGRIAVETANRLHARGHQIIAIGLPYDGLLPPQYDGQPLPYWVAALNGAPDWLNKVANLITIHQPDVVMVMQDFPYNEGVRSLPLDWSQMAFVVGTPVDGAPIYPNWLKAARQADAVVTISEFGVEAFRQAGIHADLCRPGVNRRFAPMSTEKKAELRAKLKIDVDAFVLGVMCMNQGRKAVPQMMKAFFDFALDKPNARVILDMERVGGLDLPALIEQQKWDTSKVLFRDDCNKAGVTDIAERYNVLDAHAVLSFREGYGLPISEAMACGVVSMANDYCAGTEVLKDGRGILIPSVDYFYPSGWGGAEDRLPDYREMTRQLQWLYDNPIERAAIAERGRKWAVEQTWDKAADSVEAVISRVLEARSKARTAPAPQPATAPTPMPQTAPVASQPDGVVKEVELVESKPTL